DGTRQGQVLAPAPVGPSTAMVLAATCDAFGRVALFCLETLRCLHLWKGYRDAQVAWLACNSSPSVNKECHKADVPGLVIYAPRRGLLELWTLPSQHNCPKRAAAMCVGSDCLLLSADAGQAYLFWPTGKLDRLVWPSGTSAPPTQASASQVPRPGGDDSDAFDSADSEAGECSPDAAGKELHAARSAAPESDKI
ncbi:unnamed protein product, partial [Effrenium voratum]